MDNLDKCFVEFKKSAFRYEGLQKYDVESEREDLVMYEKGVLQEGYYARDNEWCNLVKKSTQMRKLFKRVRYVKKPMSLYTKYEMEWGYKYTDLAGDNIMITVERPDNNIKDFWLFDDEVVYIMVYSPDGKFLNQKRVNDLDAVNKYIEFSKQLISKSIPYKEFLDKNFTNRLSTAIS